MNSRILGTVSVVAIVAANAALAGSPAPFVVATPIVAPAVVSPFNGLYVGAAVTSTSGTIEIAGVSVPGFESYDVDGIGGSVFAGYNFAPSAVGFFYGGELAYGMPNAASDLPPLSVDSLLTVSGRAGYVAGPFMYYGTAGFASATTDCNPCAPAYNATMTGYVYGAGIEYMITDRLSVRGQYEHFDVGGHVGNNGSYDTETSLTANVISAGLSYHF